MTTHYMLNSYYMVILQIGNPGRGEMERGMRFCGWGRECGRDVPPERLYPVVGPLSDFGGIIYKGWGKSLTNQDSRMTRCPSI